MNVYCVLILITGMIQKKKKDPLHRFFSCNINIKNDAHILSTCIFFLHMIVLYMMIFEPYH